MRKKNNPAPRTLPLLAALWLILTPVASQAAELTVLHINDSHGHLWEEEGRGGFDALAFLVASIDREVTGRGGHLLFLHGGDVNTGVPESDRQQALPDLALLRLMGCDAMVLGNHEFDNPQALLRFQESFARFPFLSANFVDARGENPFAPYRLFDLGDLRVAVLGLTTEETSRASSLNLDGGHFEDVVETARRHVADLKERADVVIALAHLGWDLPLRAGTGSEELARASIDGLDLVIDGHSHTLFREARRIGDTFVAQAGWAGRHLGRFDLTIEEGNIVEARWRAIAVAPATGRDAATTARLNYYRWQGSRKIGAIIGSTEKILDGERERIRSEETNLSHIAVDAMRERTGADVALLNGGGIRDSIAAGPVSLRDGLAVFPFGNDVVTLDLSGGELLRLLRFLASIPSGAGAFPHVSGLRCRIADGTVTDVAIGDMPLDENAIYRLATIAYLAGGGDGYEIFLPWKERLVETGYKDIDAFVAYVEANSPLDGVMGPERLVRE